MCARMPIVSVLVTCRSVPGPGARGRSLVQRTNKRRIKLMSFVITVHNSTVTVLLGCMTERIRLIFQTAKVTKQLRVDAS